MNTILVATELSQKDEKLLNAAMQIASETGAKLCILHVLHTLRMPGIADNSKKERESCRTQIHHLIKQHPVGDVEYKIHIAEGGHVYEQIDKCAQYVSADLVIMGVSEPRDYVPDLVLTTLERLLIEASYPVLVITQNFDSGYYNVAVHGRFENFIGETLGVLAPLMQKQGVTLHSVADIAIKESGFLERLWQKYHHRKDEKVRNDIEGVLLNHNVQEDKIAFLKHVNVSFQKMPKKLSNNNIDILALGPLSKNLFRGKPDPALREILYNPPCDLLIAGKG